MFHSKLSVLPIDLYRFVYISFTDLLFLFYITLLYIILLVVLLLSQSYSVDFHIQNKNKPKDVGNEGLGWVRFLVDFEGLE